MCGIAGFWTGAPLDERAEQVQLERMTDAMPHRGPDDSGNWLDAAAGIGLGFRRLAIIDTSATGHQPMASASGRYVIVFNGEVYNAAEMRRDLPSVTFRGHSDTEVMLAAIEAWGLRPAIDRFVGMFAFALWDRADRVLHLVRDRLGIKPLYFGLAGQALVFGSELKALAAHVGFDRAVDPEALTAYAANSFVPHPRTIYRSARQLPPGTMLTVRQPRQVLAATPVAYWDLRQVAEEASTDEFTGSDAEAVDHLQALLADATRLHMVSDVPLGAFLSGGTDSSLIVAEMQRLSSSPVKTFTIGFEEPGFDEAACARDVARHLGTRHEEVYVTGADALALIHRLPQMYDEPFADTSMLPTFLVSQMARQHVTVAISGDGGDELFGGYSHHVNLPSAWRRTTRLSPRFRPAAAAAMGAVGHLAEFLPAQLGNRVRGASRARRLRLSAASPEAFHEICSSYWPQPAEVVRGGAETPWTRSAPWGSTPGALASRLMLKDTARYLPDCILTKVDRASMAVSLEVRPPLLDHRIVEFSTRVPLHMKIRNGQGKWILKALLRRHLPDALVDRPKHGFSVPVGQWLRGPLRDWAENLLGEQRLRTAGFFDVAIVRQRWTELLEGKSSWYNSEVAIWSILMFEAWRDRWLTSARSEP